MSNSVLKGMSPRVQGNIPAKEQFSLNDSREKKVAPKPQLKQILLKLKTKNLIKKNLSIKSRKLKFLKVLKRN